MQSILTKKPSQAVKQAEEYLHHCEFVKRFTKATIKTYRKCVMRFIADSGTQDFGKLTNKQLEDWHVRMVKEGKSGKTVNNYQDVVICCLKYLENHGSKLKLNIGLVERAEEDHRDAVYFTDEQIEAIKTNSGGLRELLLISILYDSGMRIAEVTALQVEHIEGLKIKVVQGKGRKDRWVFMRPATKVLLDRWLNANDITTGYIFPSPTKFGDPLSHQQIRSSINKAIRRAGFDKGSAHTMRHSFITSFINNGADVFTVQTLAGHCDPKTTRRYFHTNAEMLQQKYMQYFGA